MKTPYLEAQIDELEEYKSKHMISERGVNVLIEYKKIKQLLESIKQKETNKRYFIVSYSGKINSNIFVGFTDFSTDGGFLSLKTTVRHIKEKQGIKECVITNIMEISEQDWNDWNN